jgi:hypothetical protein
MSNDLYGMKNKSRVKNEDMNPVTYYYSFGGGKKKKKES